MVIDVKIYPWDGVHNFEVKNIDLKVGDKVIVNTEFGLEAGEVVRLSKITPDNSGKIEKRLILGKATPQDLKAIERYKAKRDEALKFSRNEIKKLNLPMKLVDVQFSFDGSRVTFAFISEHRIDFREIVKNLSKHFQKSVRLQQIGSRDEAKKVKGCGSCGRELCCVKFLRDLGNVSLETARLQQLDQRGGSRLSGVCGRLRCCLAFEAELYQEMIKKMPALGETVLTKKGKGKVINLFILTQEVEVQLANEAKIRVPIKELKKI